MESKLKLRTFEKVSEQLKKMTEFFLKNKKEIKNFIINQQKQNETGFDNILIKDMNDFEEYEIINRVKDDYYSRDYLKGDRDIATDEDLYDGIYDLTLCALMSNRNAKIFEELLENKNIDENKRISYESQKSYCYNIKQEMMNELMSSLYIYKELVNDDDFLYGHREDNDGQDVFCIDLPSYGQIAFHFGSKGFMNKNKKKVEETVCQILNKKLKSKQISKDEYDKIIKKIEKEGILPEYEGRFYETSSAVPIAHYSSDEVEGSEFEKAKKEFGLSGKLIMNLTEEDIDRICNNTSYNSREIYYFAVKKEFPKEYLLMISERLKIRDEGEKGKEINVEKLGSYAINQTSAEERKQVNNHEEIKNNYIDITKNNEIGEI